MEGNIVVDGILASSYPGVDHDLAHIASHQITHLFPGAHVPLTMEGNIVVDGILASSYLGVDHDLAHIAMTPIRWFPKLAEWILDEENGCSIFIAIAEDLGKLVLSSQGMTSEYY